MPTQGSDAAFVMLGTVPMLIGWCCSLELSAPTQQLLTRAEYEPDTRLSPYIFIALQSVAAVFGLFTSFTLYTLATEASGAVPEVVPYFLVGGLFVVPPIFAASFLNFQLSIRDKDAIYGGTQETKLRHPLILATSAALTAGSAVMYACVFFSMDYDEVVDRDVDIWWVLFALLISLVTMYAAVVLMSLKRFRVELAALVTAAASCLMFFIAMHGTDYTVEVTFHTTRLFWRHYAIISTLLAVFAVVLVGVLVTASIVSGKPLQNSYPMGAALGISLMFALTLTSDDEVQVALVGLSLGWVSCMSTALSGIGERVPMGMAAGMGFALGPRLAEDYAGLGIGVALAIVLQVAVHYTTVFLLELEGYLSNRTVSSEKKNV